MLSREWQLGLVEEFDVTLIIHLLIQFETNGYMMDRICSIQWSNMVGFDHTFLK